MKKIIKVISVVIAIVVVGVVVAGTYVKVFLPKASPIQDIKIDLTKERIERGKYLAHHVAVCMDCHSTRDWTQFAGPLSGNLGAGGEKFSKDMGFPGSIYAANITPFNIGDWTDGELFRTITTGVNKNGKALFPVMPYLHYGQMDQEDVYSIIAYIRTLEPIKSERPERELDFPVSLLVNTMPQEAKLVKKPNESDKVAYGKYLVNMAACVDCHSKTDKGAVIPGTEFGGGMNFIQPAGIVRSANITPHNETGIGLWSSEAFVQRFKQYTDSGYVSSKLTPNDLNSAMPWHMYAGMSKDDLEAIYAYLHSLDPIDNLVTKFEKK